MQHRPPYLTSYLISDHSRHQRTVCRRRRPSCRKQRERHLHQPRRAEPSPRLQRRPPQAGVPAEQAPLPRLQPPARAALLALRAQKPERGTCSKEAASDDDAEREVSLLPCMVAELHGCWQHTDVLDTGSMVPASPTLHLPPCHLHDCWPANRNELSRQHLSTCRQWTGRHTLPAQSWARPLTARHAHTLCHAEIMQRRQNMLQTARQAIAVLLIHDRPARWLRCWSCLTELGRTVLVPGQMLNAACMLTSQRPVPADQLLSAACCSTL